MAGLAWLALLLAGAQDTPHVVNDPPLAPAEQQKRFHLPPGFEIQLVAAEPDIAKPMNLAFDHRGRLLVTQTVEYPFPAKEGAGRDALRVLEDSDGDGRADRFTTLADGLNIPIGVAPDPGGAIVFSIPRIWRVREGAREPLYGDVGFRDTHGLANGFTPWVDGWIYACHGFSNASIVRGADGQAITMNSGNTFRMRPDGSRVEHFTHGQVNPFGLAFDPLGNLYSADCHSLPAYLLQRGACYPTFDGRHDGLGFGPPIMAHQHGSTAIGGIVHYAADHFPPAWRGTLFIGNPVTRKINHDRLEPRGSGFRAVEQPDFLSCDDRWFRPVDLELAPDGSLYIADFYNCIIGHYEVPLDHPKRDRTRGRIWRVVYTGPDAKPPVRMPDLSTLDAQQLLERLGDPNLAVRVLVTNRMVDLLREREIPADLAGTVAAGTPLQRAHGLWVVERLRALGEPGAEALSRDSDLRVRVHLLKALAERKAWTWEWRLARAALRDAEPAVRRAAVEALGLHPHADNVGPLLDLRDGVQPEDAHLLHAVRMALRDHLAAPEGFRGAPADRRLADAAMGVRTEASARYVLMCLKAGAAPPPALHHAARYLSAEELPEVWNFATGEKAPSLGTLATLQRAAQERGMKLPAGIAAAAVQACRAALDLNEASAIEALRLVQELRIAGLHEDLARLAGRASRFPNLRPAATRALGTQEAAKAVPVLARLLLDGEERINLRQEAAAALGSMNDFGGRAELSRALATAPHALALTIAGGLAAGKEGGELLLTAVAAGKASPRVLQDRAVTGRLRAAGLEERRAALTADLPAEDDRLGRLIASRAVGFRRIIPDPAEGAKVFEKGCAACHRVEGKGGKVGPDLDGAGERGLERLLEDLLDPNRNLDPAFRASIVRTKDGRVISGLLLREEGQALVFADAEGKEVRIAAGEVERRTVSTLSPMPANLGESLPEADFYNLVAYLLTRRQSR